jgi:hypothetical protein
MHPPKWITQHSRRVKAEFFFAVTIACPHNVDEFEIQPRNDFRATLPLVTAPYTTKLNVVVGGK